MATPREGTLWGDILQINFPIQGTTWSETTHGPVTDRIFSAQFEGRWRHAPWPLLPAAAGRLYWDYAGTDFLPSGPGGCGAPDLGAGFGDRDRDGGPRLGPGRSSTPNWFTKTCCGTATAASPRGLQPRRLADGTRPGRIGRGGHRSGRARPRGWGLEPGLRVRRATWGMPARTPGTGDHDHGGSVGEQDTRRAHWRRGPRPVLCCGRSPPNGTGKRPSPRPSPGQEKSWWRVYFRVGI